MDTFRQRRQFLKSVSSASILLPCAYALNGFSATALSTEKTPSNGFIARDFHDPYLE